MSRRERSQRPLDHRLDPHLCGPCPPSGHLNLRWLVLSISAKAPAGMSTPGAQSLRRATAWMLAGAPAAAEAAELLEPRRPLAVSGRTGGHAGLCLAQAAAVLQSVQPGESKKFSKR